MATIGGGLRALSRYPQSRSARFVWPPPQTQFRSNGVHPRSRTATDAQWRRLDRAPRHGRSAGNRSGSRTMKPSSTSRFRSGFTLLEMMLAIGILSMVLVMIAGSFRAVAHSKVHGENRLNTDRE